MDGVAQWRIGDPAPPPLPRRSEADVVVRWQDGPPMVSVLCPTYQHVGFIEDALRGFLGQDTDFPFEIIVRDDASTDGTADIVQDYADRYPSIVRAVLEPVNTFRRRDMLRVLLAHARGPTVALCEGDDYWIAPEKLRLQVELLRARPECSVVSHPDIAVRDGFVVRVPTQSRDAIITPEALRRGYTMSPRTMCFRPDFADADHHETLIPASDRFLVARLGEIGSGALIQDLVGSVYRLHDGGIWSSRNRQEQAAMMAMTHFWIGDYFINRGDRAMGRHHLIRAGLQIVTAQLPRDVDPRLGLSLRMLRGWPRTVVRRLIAALRRRTS